jgi:hypothetical protein
MRRFSITPFLYSVDGDSTQVGPFIRETRANERLFSLWVVRVAGNLYRLCTGLAEGAPEIVRGFVDLLNHPPDVFYAKMVKLSWIEPLKGLTTAQFR